MYDWNGDGKHDAIDDAIFFSLLEDEAQRQKESNNSDRQSSDSTEAAGCGCAIAVAAGLLFALLGAWMSV